ncbi:MAG TPA: hypothetical protein VLW06_16895, partial [Terriglobales bacterium]|nr:hypothetical protein [Terriglobales bacterium]
MSFAACRAKHLRLRTNQFGFLAMLSRLKLRFNRHNSRGPYIAGMDRIRALSPALRNAVSIKYSRSKSLKVDMTFVMSQKCWFPESELL